jgi:cytoskeleton protein RodZ
MSAMATETTPRDFGYYLQSCRRAKGISLEAVSRMTRITPSILQRIESEECAQLPDHVFVRGFLRAYAQAVGADEEEVVRRYLANAEVRALHHKRVAPQQLSSGRSFALRFLLGMFMFSLVVAATLYYAQRESSHGAAGQAETARPATTAIATGRSGGSKEGSSPRPVPSGEEKAARPAAASVAQSKKKGLHVLEVSAVEATNLKVISDGGAPREFHLKPADRLRLEAEHGFSLLIENAGGLHVVLDGNPVAVPGKSGQVVTLQLP